MTTPDPITPEREHGAWDKTQQRYEDGCKHDAPSHATPERCTCAQDGSAFRCGIHTQADFDAAPITPERVPLTEGGELREARRGLSALYAEVPEAVARDVQQRVEAAFRALSDRLRAAGEREARLRALADEWEQRDLTHATGYARQLRALLDGDEETTT